MKSLWYRDRFILSFGSSFIKILIGSPAEDNSLIAASQRNNLADIPNEIAMLIFSFGSLTSQINFSLSYHRFYRIFANPNNWPTLAARLSHLELLPMEKTTYKDYHKSFWALSKQENLALAATQHYSCCKAYQLIMLNLKRALDSLDKGKQDFKFEDPKVYRPTNKDSIHFVKTFLAKESALHLAIQYYKKDAETNQGFSSVTLENKESSNTTSVNSEKKIENKIIITREQLISSLENLVARIEKIIYKLYTEKI